MWELGCKESWALKNWCFWTVALEETLESPLDCKEIKPVNPKRNQSWIFIERTDAETETPIIRPPDVKNWLTGKDSDAGRDWRWEKGLTEDEVVGWHHWLDGHEFEQAPELVDRKAWHAAVCGVTKSQTQLSDWTELIVMLSNFLCVCWPSVCILLLKLLSHIWLFVIPHCSQPGSSVHYILQARILEWSIIPSSRESSWPRDWSWISCVAGKFFTV